VLLVKMAKTKQNTNITSIKQLEKYINTSNVNNNTLMSTKLNYTSKQFINEVLNTYY
jgi:hypothetical protein